MAEQLQQFNCPICGIVYGTPRTDGKCPWSGWHMYLKQQADESARRRAE